MSRPHAADGEMRAWPEADVGLLSPVRVGAAVESIVSDAAWVQAMADAEAALARAQATLGLVPESAAYAITTAAQRQRIDARAVAIASRETANPVVSFVQHFTALVASVDPGAADHVHSGSTSQDILDTAAMMIGRRALDVLAGDLATCVANLTAMAHEHADTVVSGRTLALHAVPTTFGLKAGGWAHLVDAARTRVVAVRDTGLPVSLGGAAGTLAGYLEHATRQGHRLAGDPARFGVALTEAFARETGLTVAPLPWHALRAPIADVAAATAFTAGALGKLSVDVLTLSRTEIDEVREATEPGRGASSAMPHKQNPVMATLIRSAAVQVPALAAGLTQCMLAADERDAGAWHAEWLLLRECLRLTAGAAHSAVALTAHLVVDVDAMSRNVGLRGEEMATERLAIAVRAHQGKAAARATTERIVAAARLEHSTVTDAAVRDPELAALFTVDELADLLNPLRYTGAAAALARRSAGRGAVGTRPSPRPTDDMSADLPDR